MELPQIFDLKFNKSNRKGERVNTCKRSDVLNRSLVEIYLFLPTKEGFRQRSYSYKDRRMRISYSRVISSRLRTYRHETDVSVPGRAGTYTHGKEKEAWKLFSVLQTKFGADDS